MGADADLEAHLKANKSSHSLGFRGPVFEVGRPAIKAIIAVLAKVCEMKALGLRCEAACLEVQVHSLVVFVKSLKHM